MSLDNTKIAQIIIQVEEWHHPVKQVAQHFGITSARVYQLQSHYGKYGEIHQLKKRGREDVNPVLFLSSFVRISLV